MLQFLFPVKCAGCGKYDPSGFCEACRSRIPFSSSYSFPDPSRCASLGPYVWPLREAILELKFHHKKILAKILGNLLALRVRSLGWKPELIVPVPMQKNRYRVRGYNHAKALADSAASYLGIPVAESLFVNRPVAHQVGLRQKERNENVRGAFSATLSAGLDGALVLLVDDVVTTGATLSACTKALKSAGVREIYTACVAHQEGESV